MEISYKGKNMGSVQVLGSILVDAEMLTSLSQAPASSGATTIPALPVLSPSDAILTITHALPSDVGTD